jgi:hypothetical protein
MARAERLAVLDMGRTLDTAERTDLHRTLSDCSWFFLAQSFILPATLIGHTPDFYDVPFSWPLTPSQRRQYKV